MPSDTDQRDQFPPEALGLPDEETMSCEDGLVENHYYRDMRGMTLEDFERFWTDEQKLLEYADAHGQEAIGDDDAMYELEDNEVFVSDIDPGVASTVAALSVVGAVPVTSCNGWPDHYEKHPLVLFWCTEERFELIQQAAREAGVVLEAVGTPGVLVYTHDDLGLMRVFAKALVDAWVALQASESDEQKV